MRPAHPPENPPQSRRVRRELNCKAFNSSSAFSASPRWIPRRFVAALVIVATSGCASDSSTKSTPLAQSESKPYKTGAPVTPKQPGGLRAGDTGTLIAATDVAMAFTGDLGRAMAGATVINIAPGSGVDPHPDIDDLAIDKAVRDSIWSVVAERGYKPAEETQIVDRLIGFVVTIDQPSDDASLALRFGINPGVRKTTGGAIYFDERGTLVMLVIDPVRNRILWRGAAQSILDPGASSRARAKRAREAADRLLGDLPPAAVIASAEEQ